MAKRNQQHKIMIAYSRQDEPHALVITQMLKEGGFQVWSDAEIKPGEKWDSLISEHLQEASAIIVLLSESLKASRYTLLEIGMAMGMDKKVIPISLAERGEDPLRFFRHSDVIDGNRLTKEQLIAILRETTEGNAAAA